MDQIDFKIPTRAEFHTMCRLCSDKGHCLKPISSNSIISMIEECTSVKVSVGDDLPQLICHECFNLLEKITAFRKTCHDSELKFLEACNVANNENNVPTTNETEDPIENIRIKKEEESPKLEISDQVTSDCDYNHMSTDTEFSGSDFEPLVKPEPRKKQRKKEKNSSYDLESSIKVVKKSRTNQKQYRKEKEGGYDCEICSKLFTTLKGITYHMQWIHKVDPMNCTVCSKVFYYEPRFRQHEDSHKKFECERCHEEIIGRRIYDKHVLAHNTKTSYNCSVCTAYFTNKILLQSHERSLHNKRQYRTKTECPICQKKICKVFMKQHLLVHSKREKLQCPKCPETYLRQINLDEHYRRVHEQIEPVKNVLCSLCGFATKHEAHLARHLQSHSEDRPYACDKCDKTYKTPDALKKHISNVHLNIRPHVCTFCGAGFFERRYLENHKRIHTGEKPFVCTICDQAFSFKAGLYIHTQAQHVVKPDKMPKWDVTLQKTF